VSAPVFIFHAFDQWRAAAVNSVLWNYCSFKSALNVNRTMLSLISYIVFWTQCKPIMITVIRPHRSTTWVSELEFNVPFQHKHGYNQRRAVLRRQMRPIATDRVAWSVCLSSGRSVCFSRSWALPNWLNRSRYAFSAVDSAGPKESCTCIRWGPEPHSKGQLWGGRDGPLWSIGNTVGCGDAAFCQITLTTCY